MNTFYTYEFSLIVIFQRRINETNLIFHEESYDPSKIKPQDRPKNIITVFNNGPKALEFLTEGNLAFIGDSYSIHREIQRRFTATEICETKKQPDINGAIYFVLPKQSQYMQAFRIGLFQAHEVGLLNRNYKFFYDAMPKCQRRTTIYSVPLLKIRSAFYILLCKLNFFCNCLKCILN